MRASYGVPAPSGGCAAPPPAVTLGSWLDDTAAPRHVPSPESSPPRRSWRRSILASTAGPAAAGFPDRDGRLSRLRRNRGSRSRPSRRPNRRSSTSSSSATSHQGRTIWAAKVSDNVAARRERARDPVRRPPPCPRAHDRRAGALPPPPAGRQLRLGRDRSRTSSTAGRSGSSSPSIRTAASTT